jgi:hypothetical protein
MSVASYLEVHDESPPTGRHEASVVRLFIPIISHFGLEQLQCMVLEIFRYFFLRKHRFVCSDEIPTS